MQITLFHYLRRCSKRQANFDVYVLSTLTLYSELKEMERSKSGHRSEMVSFIVRCWAQPSAQGTVWRGEVEHVQSGRKTAFQELSQIRRVLQELLIQSQMSE
jgi:hypothetical protein